MGALETTHHVLMGWEMKLREEAAQMPMVSTLLEALYHRAAPLASSAFSMGKARCMLAKSQSEPKGSFYIFIFLGQSVL